MSSSFRNALTEFLSELELKGDLLIDAGGSQGTKLADRVKSYSIKQTLILDLPEPHEESPKPDLEHDFNYPIWCDHINSVGFDCPDCIPSTQIDPLSQEEYKHKRQQAQKVADYAGQTDILTAFELFDYTWNPQVAFRNIAFLLHPLGVAYASFGSFYPLHQPVDDDALRYMPAAIYKLAASVNLRVVDMVYRRPETDLFEQFYRAERMRAAKHEDHKFTGMICQFSQL